MPDDAPLPRRQFFRRGLRELLKPLANTLAPVERTLGELEKIGAANQSPSRDVASHAKQPSTIPLQLWLRPPGALSEKAFLETCSRCGECVRVCPAEAIKLDAIGRVGTSAPYIDANSSACVACDGLYCMSSCPSGALVPTPLTFIKMGTAVWHEHECTRSNENDTCQLCVDACPLGSAAIDLSGREVVVKPLACIGCGLCQQVCPTQPKAITVIPISARAQ